jgi:hypothetical protein
MKTILLSGAICALLLAACEPAQQPAAPAATNTPAQAAPVTNKAKFAVNCFEDRLPDGSVLSFQYTDYYDDIVGILDYSFAEKDGAHGTFKGKKEGNIITATWNYMVEGSNQTEEIMVKIEGDKAIKASGELVEAANGTLKLKDAANATWAELFTRVQCD